MKKIIISSVFIVTALALFFGLSNPNDERNKVSIPPNTQNGDAPPKTSLSNPSVVTNAAPSAESSTENEVIPVSLAKLSDLISSDDLRIGPSGLVISSSLQSSLDLTEKEVGSLTLILKDTESQFYSSLVEEELEESQKADGWQRRFRLEGGNEIKRHWEAEGRSLLGEEKWLAFSLVSEKAIDKHFAGFGQGLVFYREIPDSGEKVKIARFDGVHSISGRTYGGVDDLPPQFLSLIK